jgi:hypothetical protein
MVVLQHVTAIRGFDYTSQKSKEAHSGGRLDSKIVFFAFVIVIYDSSNTTKRHKAWKGGVGSFKVDSFVLTGLRKASNEEVGICDTGINNRMFRVLWLIDDDGGNTPMKD